MPHVSVTQENLARGLSVVARAVAARSPLPILGNILLATDEGGRLRLAATNLEMGIVCWIGAKVDTALATTLPAKTLVDLINTLPPDRVALTLNEKTQVLTLACERVRSNLRAIAADEFPLIPRADLAKSIEFPVDTLREMLDHVLFAAATDEARPLLAGVSMKIDKDVAVLAASDGFRLALRAARLAKPLAAPLSIIIPARALAELRRLLTADAPVFMYLPEGRGQAIFHHDSLELSSQLIEGAFPEYTAIIPKRYTTRMVVPTAEFRKACKAADIFAREAAHTARIKVEPGAETKAGRATVLASAAETGDNKAEVAATVEGEPIEVAFNIKYVLDALNAMGTEQVALETTLPTSPGALKPVGREDYLVVVMPLQLGGKAPAVAPAAQPAPAAA